MARNRSQAGFPLRLLWMAAACAVALALLAAVTPARAHAAGVPNGFVGMNDWTPPSDQAVESMSRAGIKRWRAPLFWYLVEQQRGQYDWSEYDRAAATAARQGASLMLVVASCPAWACADISGPPVSPAGLAALHVFVRAAVTRYGHAGSFWSDHPELPYAPVSDWQVWNEVNSSEFWKPSPNASDYARFLLVESAVIRAADPAATVVLSGLTNYGQVPLTEYLRQLYREPGFRESFDVVALHSYAGDDRAVGTLLDDARRVMTDAGDGARRTWVTEMGWGTSTPAFEAPTSPQRQAELLRSTYDMLIGCSGRWNLDRAYWFGYRDINPPPGQPDFVGYHTGLTDTSGNRKPAWNAMLEYPEGGTVPDGCPLDRRDAGPNAAIAPPKPPLSGHPTKLRMLAKTRTSHTECRLVRLVKPRLRHSRRGRRAARWRRCSRPYRSARLRRRGYRLQVRTVDSRGHVRMLRR